MINQIEEQPFDDPTLDQQNLMLLHPRESHTNTLSQALPISLPLQLGQGVIQRLSGYMTIFLSLTPLIPMGFWVWQSLYEDDTHFMSHDEPGLLPTTTREAPPSYPFDHPTPKTPPHNPSPLPPIRPQTETQQPTQSSTTTIEATRYLSRYFKELGDQFIHLETETYKILRHSNGQLQWQDIYPVFLSPFELQIPEDPISATTVAIFTPEELGWYFYLLGSFIQFLDVAQSNHQYTKLFVQTMNYPTVQEVMTSDKQPFFQQLSTYLNAFDEAIHFLENDLGTILSLLPSSESNATDVVIMGRNLTDKINDYLRMLHLEHLSHTYHHEPQVIDLTLLQQNLDQLKIRTQLFLTRYPTVMTLALAAEENQISRQESWQTLLTSSLEHRLALSLHLAWATMSIYSDNLLKISLPLSREQFNQQRFAIRSRMIDLFRHHPNQPFSQIFPENQHTPWHTQLGSRLFEYQRSLWQLASNPHPQSHLFSWENHPIWLDHWNKTSSAIKRHILTTQPSFELLSEQERHIWLLSSKIMRLSGHLQYLRVKDRHDSLEWSYQRDQKKQDEHELRQRFYEEDDTKIPDDNQMAQNFEHTKELLSFFTQKRRHRLPSKYLLLGFLLPKLTEKQVISDPRFRSQQNSQDHFYMTNISSKTLAISYPLVTMMTDHLQHMIEILSESL
ncbi:MAG: hypothetical protein OXC40_00605 [Proteobacteria bacterium]|nr:hypothetical protein [Pseudomonadota bacterium]